ncbi:MAG: FtsX-like permease family protein [Hyphomicrobiales bacterium]|nr:FtsX-like permease family protein [Hyphomicrobiales bacterium]
MRALDRKLVRDLWRIKGQALAAALVIATGIAMFVMTQGTLHSLTITRDAYYERGRFADVFASARRAPESLARDIAAIPGVRRVQTRISELVPLDMPGMAEPATAMLVSVPEAGQPALNSVILRRGRWIEPGRPDEAIVSEGFALAHGLEPGDTLRATINGTRRDLRITGLGLSPEFVYAIAPGELVPQEGRYAIVWMGRQALGAAFDLDAAFNSLSLALTPGLRPGGVIERLDALLERYGGTGAVERADQTSNAFLAAEMDGLASFGSVTPALFLAIAAFVLNMIIGRLIDTEREQIGLLKAFGYSDAAVAWHYAKLVLAIAALGMAMGTLAGVWVGRMTTQIYTEFFKFPYLYYEVGGWVFAVAAAIAAGSALAGGWSSILRAVALKPAQAMQPAAPADYRGSLADRLRLARLFGQPERIILRHIGRWPLRAAMTVLGIALAASTLIGTQFMVGAMDEVMEVQFNLSQRQDMTVTFVDQRPARAVNDLAAIPGVIAVEPFRAVAARLELGSRHERIGITGLAPDPRLNRPLDVDKRPIRVPPWGLTLSAILAEQLGARPGDTITVHVLEDRRPVLRLPLAAVTQDYIGKAAYMDMRALNRALHEGPAISGAHLLVDGAAEAAVNRDLKGSPAVQAVSLRRNTLRAARATIEQNMTVFSFIFTGFAALIAFGVLYNATRIALSEQGRELASLRVLGFSRREAAHILLGEVALLTAVALPLGCVIGYGFAALTTTLYDPDLFRVPLLVVPSTYAYAVLAVLVAAGMSGWLVRGRIDRLDLIEVLKTRE